jgi:hypothetical protein
MNVPRSTYRFVVGVAIGLAAFSAVGQTNEEIDWDRAKQLFRKFQGGEKLTPDEQAYLDRAKQRRQKGGQKRPLPNVSASLGLKPLPDMTAEDRYKGEDGGLYSGGRNQPPDKHLQAALELAKLIRPLDRDGNPAHNGRIVLISVGMSNTTQEFSAFMRLANRSPQKSANVVLVDGAQGGMEALAWAQPEKRFRPDAPSPWDVLDQRLKQSGVTGEQVQVVWMKQARRTPAELGEFPEHANEMKGHMVVILQKLKERFPNVRIAYLSSRIYAGYARTPLNPEPYAYESAFVVRWLIRDQIKGDRSLNHDSTLRPVNSPLLLWGPYLWADGEKGRKLDDLVWKPDDFAPDGTHPSPAGQRKVAEQLLTFFTTDPTAKGWFATPTRTR